LKKKEEEGEEVVEDCLWICPVVVMTRVIGLVTIGFLPNCRTTKAVDVVAKYVMMMRRYNKEKGMDVDDRRRMSFCKDIGRPPCVNVVMEIESGSPETFGSWIRR